MNIQPITMQQNTTTRPSNADDLVRFQLGGNTNLSVDNSLYTKVAELSPGSDIGSMGNQTMPAPTTIFPTVVTEKTSTSLLPENTNN